LNHLYFLSFIFRTPELENLERRCFLFMAEQLPTAIWLNLNSRARLERSLSQSQSCPMTTFAPALSPPWTSHKLSLDHAPTKAFPTLHFFWFCSFSYFFFCWFLRSDLYNAFHWETSSCSSLWTRRPYPHAHPSFFSIF